MKIVFQKDVKLNKWETGQFDFCDKSFKHLVSQPTSFKFSQPTSFKFLQSTSFKFSQPTSFKFSQPNSVKFSNFYIFMIR